MKKILMFIMAFCLMVPTVSYAATPLEKAQKKEMKTKMKEYKKGGYKMLASSHSMEVALLKHYEKLNALGDNAQEVTGMSQAKSKNMAQQMAVNNACIDYASKAGRSLAGRIAVDMAGNNTSSDNEFDHFYAAYESSIEKEIRGEMEHSYSVYKENPDGTIEVISYFIINEDAASKARIRAFENAQKESEAAQKHAEKISSFVRGRMVE